MERMINRRLYSWLEKSGKLHKNQAGFRKGRQTIDQLIRLTQQTADAFQQKKSVAAVFVVCLLNLFLGLSESLRPDFHMKPNKNEIILTEKEIQLLELFLNNKRPISKDKIQNLE